MVNGRFPVRVQRTLGPAEAKTDRHIELKPIAAYRHNLARYMLTIARIPLSLDERVNAERRQRLKAELLEPKTSYEAAAPYGVLAGGGLYRPVSLVRVDKLPIARRVVSPETARNVVAMLEHVVSAEGTGRKAAVMGYRVAGKTGTARKVAAGGKGYEKDRHTAVFAGITPATAPRLVIIVVIDDPQGAAYFGGDVSAPVFSKIAAGALRIMAVPPDDARPATSPPPTRLASSLP